MSRSSGDRANAVAAIDLLLNLLMLFIVVSAVAVAKMNRPESGKSVDMKAELVIELSWPDGSLDDLDLWLLLPDGQRVGFNNKDVGVAALDRDDRGGFGDVYVDTKGAVSHLIRTNREVATIRANLAGRYVVNVHYYNDFESGELELEETDPSPNPVLVKLTKLNPKVVELINRRMEVGKVGSQRTAFCFELSDSGEVTHVDQGCDVPFIKMAQPEPEA
jgi:uncharacterized protein YfaP (DUF2135 family)